MNIDNLYELNTLEDMFLQKVLLLEETSNQARDIKNIFFQKQYMNKIVELEYDLLQLLERINQLRWLLDKPKVKDYKIVKKIEFIE